MDIGVSSFKISPEPGVEDRSRVWTVYDKKNDISFEVYDVALYQRFILFEHYAHQNVFKDNYVDAVLKKNKDVISHIFEYDDDHNMVFEYKDAEDLRKKVDDLWEIYSLLKKHCKHPEFSYCFCYEPELDSLEETRYKTFSFYMANERDKVERGMGIGSKAGIYNRLRQKYMRFGYKYQIPEILAEMDEDDKNLILADSYRVYFYDDAGNIVRCNTEAVASAYDEMEFANFYLFLKSEGFNVTGDAHDFTYISPAGDEYRFCYDFLEEKTQEHAQRFYYMLNGEKTYNCYDGCVSPETLEKMCGVKVKYNLIRT